MMHHARRLQAIGIVLRREVARERADGSSSSERPGRRLEHRCLAGTGRAHHIDGQHLSSREVQPVVRRLLLVP